MSNDSSSSSSLLKFLPTCLSVYTIVIHGLVDLDLNALGDVLYTFHKVNEMYTEQIFELVT